MNRKTETSSVLLDAIEKQITSELTFEQALVLWMESQFDAITAKHKADVAFAVEYEKANSEMGPTGKPLTEKAKENQAFLVTAPHTREASILDLRAKTYYNIMLKLRDEHVPDEVARLFKEAYKNG